ncbi:MAG: serine/threonine protein kinase [Archangium sp.]
MSANIPDLTGRKIGEYEIVSRVGVGGMGAVYEGKQPLIGKRVAVKVLLPSLSNEEELVERFLAEARSVNEIRHRGIVDIFSFGQLPEGSHYFVMEYLQGEPFDKIIKHQAPMPLAEALGWVDEMLDALDAAHAAGIIHRDIKPSNLFLVNTGRGRPYVKLLDFGIAKLGVLQGEATPQTRASVILGTPDYISPEQARGKPISPQTDLYALGCVLFEMVTGERVFRGENTLQTMWMHVEDVPPVPSAIRPDIPPQLDDAILWALQKDPEKRPPTAAALRDVLAAIRGTLSPSGQFTPPPITGSSQRPLSHTPPPSGRSRPVGTPGPRSGAQAPLGTPMPVSGRSGSQAPVSERTRVARPTQENQSGQETRVAPATVMQELETDPSRPAVPRPASQSGALPKPPVLDTAARSTDAHDVATPPKSKLPLVLAGAVGVLLVAIVGFVIASNRPPEVDPLPPIVVSPPVEPTKPPKSDEPTTPIRDPKPEAPKEDPRPLDPPEEDPPQQDPPKKDPPNQNPPKIDPRPNKPGITVEKLVGRLRKVESALAAKEAETGQKDPVMRQFVEQAKKQIKAASTDAERRDAWGFLGDLEGQLKH